ncbi:hypothetical protein KC622_03710 [Candidatus Dojkabacteria bacterium]|uniref:Uncharacterized protein n=1 Tax=Candidatus Dojkabacteria bacterium TaxID=2099670 RepID=A0A955KWQ7_9BACT|nr:hypothetical protein [Candidatus Dojkabacteria bacterium]MCB9790524.1 hypothetical protein [Candidatus Nomurabacteria bacterium]
MKIKPNFVVFLLFFGVALITAIQDRNWLLTAFWFAIGFVFFWSDLRKDT